MKIYNQIRVLTLVFLSVLVLCLNVRPGTRNALTYGLTSMFSDTPGMMRPWAWIWNEVIQF